MWFYASFAWARPGVNFLSQSFAVDAFDQELGSFLARLRERSGMSQETFAAVLGRDQSVVSKTERGLRRVTVSDLLAWLAAAGTNLSAVAQELHDLRSRTASRSLWPGGR